jgi:hypothetical protein
LSARCCGSGSGVRTSWLCFPTMGGTTSLCFWGYEQAKRCEPMPRFARSGAVTPQVNSIFVCHFGRGVRRFLGARHAPGLARRCRRGGALLPRCRQSLRCPRNRNPPTDTRGFRCAVRP